MRKKALILNYSTHCSTLDNKGGAGPSSAPTPPDIRPQYHFRKIDGHTHIWDVRKLIGIAEGLPVKDIPLTQISEIDETYWFDGSGPVPTCRAILDHMRLVENADLRWPIILCPNARVMDGMHRVLKALLVGNTTIQARSLVILPVPDFVDVAPSDLPY
ncbi:MAG: hypothetical protein ABJ251_07945 [Paracoccaceae bacterium]